MNHKLLEEHSEILHDVLEERQRQNEKFGSQRNQHPFLWNTILGEEVGEANQQSLDMYFKTDPMDQFAALKNYRTELIQVAAVAIAIVQDLDSNGRFEKSTSNELE